MAAPVLTRAIMSRQPDPLIQKLIARLSDEDPVVRRNAAAALRLHGRRAAIAAAELARLLDDENPRVRAEAQRALNRLRVVAA
jgi:HEAT repeat protein